MICTFLFIPFIFQFQVDSYSAFYNNGGFSSTELESKLIELGVHKIFVTGLALDFCVFYSAMDADHLGTYYFVFVFFMEWSIIFSFFFC